jgi:hypothetical protein
VSPESRLDRIEDQLGHLVDAAELQTGMLRDLLTLVGNQDQRLERIEARLRERGADGQQQ